MLEPEDYYIEDGKYVLTAQYLLKRGFCCGNICRHCPYGEDIQRAASGKRPEDGVMDELPQSHQSRKLACLPEGSTGG